MYLLLEKFLGRTGNNIIQLVNCIKIAIHLNCNIIILSNHPLIKDNNEIIINKNLKNKNNIIKDIGEGKWFGPHSLNNFFEIGHVVLDNNIKIPDLSHINIIDVYKILENIFKVKFNKDLIFPEKDLYIHIRSDHIFEEKPPFKWYFPPPLSYYVNIIKSGNYDNIYIISDNCNNIISRELKKKFDNIILTNNNLLDDIKIIMHCKHLIYSVGTFPQSFILFNKNLKTFYYPSYNTDFLITFLTNKEFKNKCKKINLEDYKSKMGYGWRCNKYQVNHMLTY